MGYHVIVREWKSYKNTWANRVHKRGLLAIIGNKRSNFKRSSRKLKRLPESTILEPHNSNIS
jgi:hypothetical protein